MVSPESAVGIALRRCADLELYQKGKRPNTLVLDLSGNAGEVRARLDVVLSQKGQVAHQHAKPAEEITRCPGLIIISAMTSGRQIPARSQTRRRMAERSRMVQ